MSDLPSNPVPVAQEQGWALETSTSTCETSVHGASGPLASRVWGGLPVITAGGVDNTHTALNRLLPGCRAAGPTYTWGIGTG